MSTRNPATDAYFGDSVLDAGYVIMPHLLLRHYAELGIGADEVVFLMMLMAIRWDVKHPPRDMTDIAQRMGVSVASVRRYSTRLNTLGLIIITERRRKGMRISNEYNLRPLWERLRTFAGASPPEDPDVKVGRVIKPKNDPPTPAPQVEEPPHHRSKMSDESRSSHRSKMSGLTPSKMTGLTQSEMSGLTPSEMSGPLINKEEDQATNNAVAAAATFTQIISHADARLLIAKYPACIPHAAALVAEASGGANPPGLLVHLVKSGWTPPISATIDEDDPDIDWDLIERLGLGGKSR